MSTEVLWTRCYFNCNLKGTRSEKPFNKANDHHQFSWFCNSLFSQVRKTQLESCAITGSLNKVNQWDTAFSARHSRHLPGTLTTASLSYSSTTTKGGDSASSLWSPCNTKSLNSSIWFHVGERVWEMTWKVGPKEKQKVIQVCGGVGILRCIRQTLTDGKENTSSSS